MDTEAVSVDISTTRFEGESHPLCYQLLSIYETRS